MLIGVPWRRFDLALRELGEIDCAEDRELGQLGHGIGGQNGNREEDSKAEGSKRAGWISWLMETLER